MDGALHAIFRFLRQIPKENQQPKVVQTQLDFSILIE
jgi:hypothetical protein